MADAPRLDAGRAPLERDPPSPVPRAVGLIGSPLDPRAVWTTKARPAVRFLLHYREEVTLTRRIGFMGLVLAWGFAGCTEPAEQGQECVDSFDCAEGLSCFEHQGADPSPVCMSDCDLTLDRFCADGSVCTRVIAAPGSERPADLGVCYLGGATLLGEVCADNLECEQGTICVGVGPEDAREFRCYAACHTSDGSTCVAPEACQPLQDMEGAGYCAAG